MNVEKGAVVSGEFSREYWEERYRTHSVDHGAEPNPQLTQEVAALAPGAALDAGCGVGADALWLAARGWRVTAVDISATALDRARERAGEWGDEVAGRIEWMRADLAEWAPPEGRFDLVTAHYVHPSTSNDALFRRLAAAVAPGGTLLVVGHQPSDEAGHPHAPAPESHITADEVAALLEPGEWDIDVAEARVRHTMRHGEEITLHDAVLRARKRQEA